MADNKEDLVCPICGNTMTKILMADVNTNVDICLDGCGGILFDNRELEKFDEQHENITEILEAIKNKTFEEVDTQKALECPVCGNAMIKMGSDTVGIQLDVCGLCGAKYLNNNELQAIRVGEKTTIDASVMELFEQAHLKYIEEIDLPESKWKISKFNKAFMNVVEKIVFKL